jgi:hypothetical protein
MLKRDYQEGKKKINIHLCLNCVNCKERKNKVYCSKDYFKDIDKSKVTTYIPQDFDCYEFEEI